MNPVLKRIIQLLALTALQAALLCLSAWSLTWLEGWLYVGIYIFLIAASSFIMLPKRPEVVAERSKGAEGGKPWDLLLTRLMAIPSLGMLVVAGLDHHFGWKPDLGLSAQVVGVVLYVLGYIITIWAMYTNKFFSSVVRIQKERGHQAITSGPYRFVRHPGYVGMVTSALGAVLLLNSVWAFIAFALYVAVVVTRTALEDKTLQAELDGYKEFAAHTRYRLIPGIW
jgi:protein-S-isoprenylcysteine O-methyltransferase Ste14